MGVKFKSGGGSAPTLFFSDTFDRANASAWGQNWLNVYGTNFAGAAAAQGGRYGQPSVVANQGVVTTVNAAGTPATLTVLIPVPTFASLYTQAKTFAKCTWITKVGNNTAGLALRFNTELTNGIGACQADFYRLLLDNGSGGQIQRMTGNGFTTVQVATWANAVANDIFEFRATDLGATGILLETFRNNALVTSVLDNSAGAGGRILMGSPGFHYDSGSVGAPATVTINDFSCGIF